MRKVAREVCFSLLFEYLFLNETNSMDKEQTVFDCRELDEEDNNYISDMYSGIIKEFDTLKTDISSYLKDYSIDRIYKVDLAILLLAFYEIKHSDTPKAVVIDEAVRIAKVYSTDNSTGFINGILAELVRRTA